MWVVNGHHCIVRLPQINVRAFEPDGLYLPLPDYAPFEGVCFNTRLSLKILLGVQPEHTFYNTPYFRNVNLTKICSGVEYSTYGAHCNAPTLIEGFESYQGRI